MSKNAAQPSHSTGRRREPSRRQQALRLPRRRTAAAAGAGGGAGEFQHRWAAASHRMLTFNPTVADPPLRALVVIALSAFLACTHGSGATRLDAELTLNLVDTVVEPDSGRATATFAIVNTTDHEVEFCFFDGGVSVWTRGQEQNEMAPLVLHSLVHDATCHHRTRLHPNQEVQLTETTSIPGYVPCDSQVAGSIRLHRPRDRRGNVARHQVVNLRSDAVRKRLCEEPSEESRREPPNQPAADGRRQGATAEPGNR